MAEFHFLRPYWLLLAPVGAWLIWQLLRGRADGGGWRTVVDASLRPHVLAEPEVLRDSRLALLAALAAWVLAVVGLAGPAWERLPVPAFRSDEALVVALDLSRSMDAADVEPSRLARAKLKLLDLLERRAAGQTALVVFSTHAFTVTPLTTDTRTIASLVSAVDTNIMPTQGGSLAAGMMKAAMLLEQTGLTRGDILLITDSEVAPEDVDLAGDLAGDGYRVSVLAVGTDQGAPIPQPEGGFVTDSNGQVVIPQLDAPSLQRLAATGGGRYAALAPNDRDLDTLFPAASPLDVTLEEAAGEQYEADVWLDRGLVLVVVLLPLLALSFRRGWICVFALVFLAPLPRAQAFEWQDLWQRPDQRGVRALEAQEAQRAAELFENPEWRSAAQYRAEQFEASAASLTNIDSAEGHYNRGNALAKAGQLPAAIAAYDRALELNPGHEDARYNRDLVEQFLRDNPEQQQQPQPQEQQGDQNQQGDSDQSQSQSGEQQDGEQSSDEQSQQGQQGESGDSQANDGAQEQQEPSDSEQQADDNAEQDANAGEQDQQQASNAAGPDDVEQWASEQAAEQWLRRVPQDPGGLLRRKFLYQYQRMGVDQDGNRVEGAGAERRPW
ncbi:MAG TPA: VWA domain-containing protein [Gammaproteobacteria bacterium]|nr:VWA domain-containing protein [Gammaproteobacteria bacterium]